MSRCSSPRMRHSAASPRAGGAIGGCSGQAPPPWWSASRWSCASRCRTRRAAGSRASREFPAWCKWRRATPGTTRGIARASRCRRADTDARRRTRGIRARRGRVFAPRVRHRSHARCARAPVPAIRHPVRRQWRATRDDAPRSRYAGRHGARHRHAVRVAGRGLGPAPEGARGNGCARSRRPHVDGAGGRTGLDRRPGRCLARTHRAGRPGLALGGIDRTDA